MRWLQRHCRHCWCVIKFSSSAPWVGRVTHSLSPFFVCPALEAAKRLKKGQRCVVILPDSVRNYMSKFLNDDWMWERGHVDADRSIGVSKGSSNSEWWHSKLVSDLSPQAPSTVLPTVKCSEAVTILAKGGFDQLPVVSADGEVLGVVTEGNLASKLTSGRVKPNDPVTKVQFTRFRKVWHE